MPVTDAGADLKGKIHVEQPALCVRRAIAAVSGISP
jgi:hypothetical protein